MITQVIASMLGTLAFVILLNAPKKEYVYCVVNGGFGWLTYLLLMEQGVGVTLSSLAATFMLTIVARALSIIRRSPTTIFLVAGIFTLVPGTSIYYTAYHLIINELSQSGAKGLETFKIAGAIVLGIVFGFSIPQGWFNQLRRRNKHVG
jgi:uncharacterized membrane protein YjjB (DUF3815 family)